MGIGKGVGETAVSPWRSARTDGFVGASEKRATFSYPAHFDSFHSLRATTELFFCCFSSRSGFATMNTYAG